jgi:hypothetical protein
MGLLQEVLLLLLLLLCHVGILALRMDRRRRLANGELAAIIYI